MNTLLRCPHCGSETEFFVRNNFGGDYKSLIIECKECFASMEILIDADALAEDFEKEKKELFENWNQRVERTAKVIEHEYRIGTSLNIVGEPKICHECLCDACKKKVLSGDDYCSHCGAKLDWSD